MADTTFGLRPRCSFARLLVLSLVAISTGFLGMQTLGSRSNNQAWQHYSKVRFRLAPLPSTSPQARWTTPWTNTALSSTPTSIQDLANRVATESPTAFARLFSLAPRAAQVVVPEAFASRVRTMFASYPGGTASLGFVERQTVVTARNRVTEEYSMFNEVRRYRPGYQERLSADKDAELHAELMQNAGAATCDFCSVERTAEDVFGRVHGKHCYTAANIAKYERWHSLLVSHAHHPLNLTAEMLEDYIRTAHTWFAKANSRDPSAQYPHIMFDAGARSSASQPHQHMQMSLTADRYYTRTQQTRNAGQMYERQTGRASYWADVVAAHDSVGLAYRFNRTAVLSYVTPIKERELIVVTEDSRSPCFASLIAVAIDALRDDVGTRAFSMAVTLEPLSNPQAPEYYPAMARLVDRGSPLDKRSDVGAMEFYGANNIGADPFHIVPHLAKRVLQLWREKQQPWSL